MKVLQENENYIFIEKNGRYFFKAMDTHGYTYLYSNGELSKPILSSDNCIGLWVIKNDLMYFIQ